MEVMLGERRQKSRLVISPLSLVTPGACETVCNTRNTSQLIDQIPGFHHMISYIVKLLFIDLSLRNGAFSFVPQNFDTNYNDNKDKNRKKKVIIITIRKRLSRHTHKMEALVLSRRKWGRQLGSQSKPYMVPRAHHLGRRQLLSTSDIGENFTEAIVVIVV